MASHRRPGRGDAALTRLLLIQPFGERGGAETVLLNTLRHLDRGRFRPRVVMLADGPLRREVEELAGPVPVVAVGRVREPARYLGAMARLVRLVRALGPDLVASWCTSGQAYGGVAARLTGVPAAWMEHGEATATALARFTATTSRVDTFVANSKRVDRAWRRDHPRLRHRPGRVVYPGIDLDSFQAPGRAGLELPAGRLAVGIVGRLQRWKGQDLFLEALALARREHPELHGLVVGSEMFGRDPGFGQELEERAARPDLAGHVTFTGFVPDVPPLLRSLDLVVHASRDPEPFGQVVFEALAAGVPVIAADAGGPAELLHDGEEALLVPAQVQPLAAAMVRLAGDPGLRRRLAGAGRALVRRDLGAEAMTHAYEAAWAEVAR
ncbi:MAG: glycosyltransferase [Candidatus Dormibacteria bacterium]